MKQPGDCLILLDCAQLEVTAHKGTTFLIMLMECAYNHTLHLLVRPDVEESVVEFTSGHDAAILLHLLEEFEESDAGIIDILVEIDCLLGVAFGLFLSLTP